MSSAAPLRVHPPASAATARLAALLAADRAAPVRASDDVAAVARTLRRVAVADAAHARGVVAAAQTRAHRGLAAVAVASAAARAAALLAAALLLGASIAALLSAGLGAGPWDVLVGGVAAAAGASHGAAAVAVGAAAVAGGVALAGGRVVGAGTLVLLALVGPTVDVVARMLPAASGPARWALVAAAVVGVAAAVTLVVAARLSGGPVEALAAGLRSRGVPLRRARGSVDAVACVAGWVAGGPAGLATVVVAAAVAPLVWWALPPQLR